MLIIDDLLLSPVTAFKFILGQIQSLADREISDESFIKEQLLELEMRRELDEISDREHQALEAELFARLRAIRGRHMEALGTIHTAESTSLVIDFGGDEGEDAEEAPE